jgi:hypothetical protein
MRDMKKIILSILCLSLFMASCQKKELHLDLIETACKNFKISEPERTWISDPSCGGTSVNASVQITFKYDGKKECIDHIDLAPKFYRANNSEIGNIQYTSRLMKSDPKVNINSSTVTFIFDFTFANTSDADALNHLNLKLHIENELEHESNKLELRINSTCPILDPSTYKVKSTTTVSSSTVQITLYDDAAEDGDIVSVFLNNVWVLENYTLTKAGQTFTYNVSPGNNHLVLFAVNEGSSGPNTVAISVNGGSKINLSPDLLTGEAVNIQF